MSAPSKARAAAIDRGTMPTASVAARKKNALTTSDVLAPVRNANHPPMVARGPGPADMSCCVDPSVWPSRFGP